VTGLVPSIGRVVQPRNCHFLHPGSSNRMFFAPVGEIVFKSSDREHI
jgi:hypothetical protein